MRRLASIALLGTLTLLASNAQSQVRGGGGMRGGGGVRVGGPAPRVSSGRPAPAARPSFNRGPSFGTQAAPVGNLNGQRFNGPRFNGQRFNAQNGVFFDGRSRRFHSGFFRHHNHIFFNNGFFGANCFGGFAFGNPFCNNFISPGFVFVDPFFSLGFGFGGYGFGGYPYGYPPPPDYYPQQSSTSSDSNQIALTAEIQHLSDEIDDLREERNRDQQSQYRSQPSSGSTLSAVPPAANTIFVLRDGQRITAQNYAISGQTLWILNERTARKTPLADIDRAATEKANAANGVEVHLPEAAPPK